MSTVRYVGHGVEIEDDTLRLSRRMVESRGDAVRRGYRGKSQRRHARGPVSRISAAIGRRR